jgi:hypothetical protein
MVGGFGEHRFILCRFQELFAQREAAERIGGIQRHELAKFGKVERQWGGELLIADCGLRIEIGRRLLSSISNPQSVLSG